MVGVEFDAKLAGLAAEIVRDALADYDRRDIARWLAGRATVTAATHVGVLPGGWDMASSFVSIGHAHDAIAPVSVKTVFGLAATLPPVRLPSAAGLAGQARSAPLMARLEALAGWLGPDGRPVNRTDELSDADAADAASWLRVGRGDLRYLWEYALTAGWFELDEDAIGQARAVPGETARRWADDDDSGVLHVWAVIFASVLAAALDVAAAADPDAARKLNFRGQGAAAALLLFVARRPGLSRAEVGELIMDGAVGDPASPRALRAWDAWVREHGDPAGVLLADLAALGAVTAPDTASGVVGLTPLALWALREQLARDGIDIPLLPVSLEQMPAAGLIAMAEGVTEAEFETESAAWVAGRGPEQAARELLAFAASAGARERLAAVNLTRTTGVAAHAAWRQAMRRPELRGYARIALTAAASERPDSTLPLVLEPAPDDLTWVATDLLALACGEEDPDPRQVAAQFREAVPLGEESWIFDLMSRSSHPDVVQVLTVLGRRHPDRRVARYARRAAQAAARSRTAAAAATAAGRATATAARPEPSPARPPGH
jgi:hypothetical protein